MISALGQPLVAPLTMMLAPVGLMSGGSAANVMLFNGLPLMFNGRVLLFTTEN